MNAGEAKKPDRALRSGFTTGACSAAAAKAATQALVTRQSVGQIEIVLPIGKTHTFVVERCELAAAEATCAVVKDAGDDPDCTHGAHLTATVSWTDRPGEIELDRGSGVGLVTKPGLGLEVGTAAINPVPRRNITDMVREAAGDALAARGLRVVISVPGGEEMAKHTQNDRLGIVGGISILGTTGIVVPYSTAAYKASIVQGIDVARAAGNHTVVLTTGGKSEEFAIKILGLPLECYVQMGDFAGFSLRAAMHRGIERIHLCGMPGKMSKLATGKMQTHVACSEVDLGFLASIAADCGAPREVVDEVRQANTARHVSEIVAARGVTGFWSAVAQRVVTACRGHIHDRAAVECILTDFGGNIIGRAST
ncbi:MAG TPA: cobalt-precorrin-5B (C(1))-methyltransferase [Pirellulales bacterium]|jgi:cobalt-precorrin-5B (C1)-methyltransferase|nr:cobalt-precorrin-5B (C(1))-methyltransferase [Pirellulales bacterium]